MATVKQEGNGLATAAQWLAIIGAINWGLVGFFNFNLVDAVLGGGAQEQTTGIARIVYAIVGLAGLALLFLRPRLRGPARVTA